MTYSDSKYIIFGAGSFGKYVYSNFINKNNIVGFVDNKITSKKINNLTVLPIDYILKANFNYIIICSEPGRIDILKQLIELKIKKNKILIAEKNHSELVISKLERVGKIFVKEQIDCREFLYNTNCYQQLLEKYNQLNNSINSNILFLRKQFSLQKIEQKLNRKEKIKVAFFVIWSSQFTFSPLFNRMLEKDSVFEPLIIVCRIPNLSMEDDKRYLGVYEKSLKDLTEKYGSKYVKPNYVNGKYTEIQENINIAFFSMIHPFAYHKSCMPETLFKRNILLYFCDYSINVAKKSEQEIKKKKKRYSQLKFLYFRS